MRRKILLAALALTSTYSWSATPRPVIKGPTRGEVGQPLHYYLDDSVSDAPLKVILSIDAPGGGAATAEPLQVWYDKGDGGKPGLAIVTPPMPGSYLLIVTAKGTPEGATEPVEAVAHRNIIVGAQPTPTPPPPPVPGPGPGPGPGPAPIPAAGLRVLIVFETADATSLPAGQRNVLYSQAMRTFLDSKCPLGPDGKTHEWRIYDADVVGAEEPWKSAMSRPRTSLPWVVISNGTSGYEGPLPSSVEEMKTLVSRYAG
jgi:hypothetical protein